MKLTNKEHYEKYGKKRYQENKDKPEEKAKRLKWQRDYHEKNKEKLDIQKKEYYERNKNKIKAQKKIIGAKWRAENKEEINKRKMESYHKNKDKPENKEKRKKNWTINSMLKRFGITPEQYYELLELQGGVCKICGNLRLASNQDRMGIDHCHKEEKIRGILCNWCNSGLGQFGDNIDLLKKAIEYLENNGRGINIGKIEDVSKFSNASRNMRYLTGRKD